MDNLRELAKREMAVLTEAQRVSGLMKNKDRILRNSGVYAEASAIHAAYVKLATPPGSSTEALKRAIFLGWYQAVEPPCFTGVADLDENEIRQSHRLLDEARMMDRIDAEFAAMLGYYWNVAAWYFEGRATGDLLFYMSGLAKNAYKSYSFGGSILETRGQMGDYWISVIRIGT